MKYINNGVGQNIIKDSDINLSESFQNQNLAEVLNEYRQDLDQLKSNVKWLAKYGGVGGSGGSGSSDVKLKYKVDIKYTNNAGIEQNAFFASKTSSNSILAQAGTKATVTITLQRCLPNTNYVVKLSYGEQHSTLYVNSLTLTASQNITCYGNNRLNIIVYATPEDMPETGVTIYTISEETTLDLVLESGATISSGNTVLQSQINEDGTKLIGKIINYLPQLYQGEFKRLTVNGTVINLESENSIGSSGESITTFSIPAKSIFNIYGIYEVELLYTYNNIEKIIKNVYVYKDENVFVYCFGKNNTVYAVENNNPNTSNFAIEEIKGRVYQEVGKPSSEQYDVKYTISYEGKGVEENITGLLGAQASNTDFTLKFQNKYSKSDFADENSYKKVTIQFVVKELTFTYYVYIRQMSDIDYIFKRTYKDGNGNDISELFYNTDHSCTATSTEDINPNTTFPFENGQFKKLYEDETHLIKRLTSVTSLHTQTGSVNDYIENKYKSEAAVDPDVLLSFGLKYSEYNLDLPILTINVRNNFSIVLYSNKIKYGGTNEYTRWFIPNDNQYHLIQLYYKPKYTIDGSSYTEGAPTNAAAFMFCIDGVMETQPIMLYKDYSFVQNESSIVYHPGNWDFNFIGVASFNAKPSQWNAALRFNQDVIKYMLDFDPIIPANYYQAYYSFVEHESMPHTFDYGIYTKLYSSVDINNVYGVSYYKGLNKFIISDVVTLGKLTNLPIYIVEPMANAVVTGEEGIKINEFLYNTYAGGYSESSTPPKVSCEFKKCEINGAEVVEKPLVNDSKYTFSIEYQGSSTLKYGAKNFEIYADSHEDDQNVSHPVVWTPDEDKFLPEQSFTLKADIVDSSHSNNVIVGKFVNDYMQNSAFKEDGDTQNIKTCLEGFPILLFMRDILQDSDVEQENTKNSNIIFLGIYSFNLGRKSMYNLGYKKLNKDQCDDISGSATGSKAYLLKNDEAIRYPYKYRVAEVQDNSPVLFDYSQYDSTMLSTKMLGDFFNYDGSSESSIFTQEFQRPLIGLGKLIYHNYIKELNEDNYTPYSFNPDNSELAGYYTPKEKACLFNVLQLNFNYKDKYSVSSDYYYKPSFNQIKPVPTDGLILNNEQIQLIKPYLTVGTNNLTIIGNPLYQFHLICNSTGDPFGNTLYYVEKLDSLLEFDPNSDDYFEYDTMLRYYIICMLFAMVDSVQKNLTIRCKDYNANTSNPWLLGFYDMDTSFGVDNVGNPVDFKAFSDYITPEGKVISDYYEENSATSDGSGFDVPSSFLFLAAKYLNILSGDGKALGTRTYESSDSAVILKTPFNYWQSLRQGELKDVDRFFEKYVDNHFSEVNPLIWNLNYMYKYFSATGVQNNEDTDTELSKFNGTRRFSRKNWLKQRLEVVDVLFGIRNNHAIGNSNASYICKQKENDSIETQQQFTGFIKGIPISATMFPAFAKGVTGVDILANVTTYPKAPVVLQTSTSAYNLYLSNNSGVIDNIRGNISSNTDVGFYGTTNIKALNECGQFLWNSNNNQLNTITNDVIQDIIIDKGPANGKQSIQLSLNDLSSVKNIRVNSSGTSSKKYKCSDFTIIVNKNNEDTQNNNLSQVEFRYVNVGGSLTIKGENTTLTIDNLILENCTCEELELIGVKVNTLTLENCSIKNYTLEGAFPTLNISDGSAVKFNLHSLQFVKTTISMPGLSKLYLKGRIQEFYNHTNTPNCTIIDISEISYSEPILHLSNFSGYSEILKIECTSDVNTLYLGCTNNARCLGYEISATSLKNVYLRKAAFQNNSKATAIKLNGKHLVNQSGVNIYVQGNYTFYGCNLLVSESCIPNTIDRTFTLQSTDHSYMYGGNPNLSMLDVIRFFNTAQCNQNKLDLTGIFRSCENIELVLTPLDEVMYTLPENYTELVQALQNFIQNKRVNFTQIFARTRVKFLDNTLVNIFKYIDDTEVSLINPCCACYADTDEQDFIHITYDFIKDTGITSITLGGRVAIDSRMYAEVLSQVVDTEEVMLEDGTTQIQFKVMDSVNINTLLNSGKLSTIDSIHLYTSDNVEINCEDGLPSTVKTVRFFNSIVHKFNFTDLTKLFDSVNQECEVYFDLFFGRSKVIQLDNPINIFDLFWKSNQSEVVPKVTLKLHTFSTLGTSSNASTISKTRGSEAINYCPSFSKTCTATEFKYIMQYFINLQQVYLDTGNTPTCTMYNQIPGLFKYCTITQITGNFKDLITASDRKSYFTVRLKTDEDGITRKREANFIDLDSTFCMCELFSNTGESIAFDPSQMWEEIKLGDDIYKTIVINLYKTFTGTYQYKLMAPLNIRWVKSMYQSFYNCSYIIPEEVIASAQVLVNQPVGNVSFSYSWSWYNNFPLIPAQFFNGFSNCDVTKCFANDSCTGHNLQGQLPRNKDELWWSGTAVNTSTISNLCQNALLHPTRKITTIDEEEVINYYVYPKIYTDTYGGFSGMFNHVVLPMIDTVNGSLYLFENTVSDGKPINLSPSLPKLPNNNNSTWYDQFLFDKGLKLALSSDDVLYNDTNVMNKSAYKKLIPNSLFLIIPGLKFNTYDMADSKPLVYDDGLGYSDNWKKSFIDYGTPTPGGLTYESLDQSLQNILFE